MGSLIGTVVGEVVDAVAGVVERRLLAAKLRDVADRIERGDIVPDKLLAKAKATAKKVEDARAKYREKP